MAIAAVRMLMWVVLLLTDQAWLTDNNRSIAGEIDSPLLLASITASHFVSSRAAADNKARLWQLPLHSDEYRVMQSCN